MYKSAFNPPWHNLDGKKIFCHHPTVCILFRDTDATMINVPAMIGRTRSAATDSWCHPVGYSGGGTINPQVFVHTAMLT
jgi:hypothetical protein